MVWDLGCNTGRFSRIAAKYAGCVVAVDSDHASIERLYRELQRERQERVLPLVGDVADLSPSLGWCGRERRAFVDRGRPQLVLCLALIHHLAITANIPVADLVRWLHSLGAHLIVEFPLPGDPMVRRLLLARDQSYDDYTVESFEAALGSCFHVHERLVLANGTRHLYHASPQSS
jgi:ribosomal protein L11 methylase PrmA